MMTLEEAIRHREKLIYGHNRLKQIKAVTLEECKRVDEWLQIVEWLKELKERREQDVPDTNDPISRQAVLNLIANYDLSMGQVVRGIHALPSAQQWIPCSERLPEDMQFVLLTVRRLKNEYNHEPFISVGYIGWNQQHWWCAHDGDCEISKVEVIAWMPLPEPYVEKENR